MADTFLTFVANFGNIRRAEVDGRNFYVAPVTLIVPGVLHGSQGPLLYTRNEVAMSVNRWDGVELTLGHPANKDERVVLGTLKNPAIRNGRLVAEAWVDAELARNADERILEALRRNETVEVSTGLLVTHEPKVGVWNGRVYHSVARDFRPDHLAILPDKIGACSVRDGCGLNVSNCTCGGHDMSEMTENQRDELIVKIIENSGDVFSETDNELLGQMSDNQLLGMRQQQVDLAKKVKNTALPPKTKPKPKTRKTTNTRPVENELEDEDEDNDPPQHTPKTPAVNMQAEIGKFMKGLSAEQFYEMAPPEVQEVLSTAKRTHNERKTELIEELTANCTNSEVKETLAENFATKDIEELELLARAYNRPTPSDNNPFAINYVGNAGSPRPTPEATKKDREDYLPVPTMNWDEKADAVAV